MAVEPVFAVTRFVCSAAHGAQPASWFRTGRGPRLARGRDRRKRGHRRPRRLGRRVVGLGILGGAFVGIPAGVFTVYKRYRNAFDPRRNSRSAAADAAHLASRGRRRPRDRARAAGLPRRRGGGCPVGRSLRSSGQAASASACCSRGSTPRRTTSPAPGSWPSG